MKSKNVLVVINLLGSAKNFVGNQFKYLSEHGYNMHLVCSPHPELKEFAMRQGISYEAIQLNRQFTPWQDFKSLWKLCKYIKKHNIDTVIGHQVKGRLLATLASFIVRVPNVIIFAHGAVFETAKGVKKSLLIAESKLESLLSDKIICVSNYIKELRLQNKIDAPEKQFLLGLGTCGGIDTKNLFNPDLVEPAIKNTLQEKYELSNCDFVIGFVGRLVRDKGVVELIDAFNIVKEQNPDKSIKLLIIGNPETRNRLPEATLEIIKSTRDIVYTGHVPHENMPALYLCMDCLVLPSYREGFGMCNIEAQAMGIPVLTSFSTGSRDSIVNELTGFYVKIDSNDIAARINHLLNSGKILDIGNAGKKWVRTNFDHYVIWPHLVKLLESF